MVVYNIFQILPYSRLLITKAKVKELYDNEDSAKNSAIFSLSFPQCCVCCRGSVTNSLFAFHLTVIYIKMRLSDICK